ncbi:MAG TPA: hypothetical protein VH988_00610 [Thermoanaerobaculia bacterium]|jgi:tetratricopeptide (TPR) repeat protein|nr:hypothetical protein [Thermoanaerobaculia bacterium]
MPHIDYDSVAEIYDLYVKADYDVLFFIAEARTRNHRSRPSFSGTGSPRLGVLRFATSPLSVNAMRPSLPTGLPLLTAGALLGCALTLLSMDAGRAIFRVASAADTGSLASDLAPFRLTEGRWIGQTAYAPYPTPLPLRGEQAQEIAKMARSPTAGVRDRLLYDLANNRLDSAIAEVEEAVQKAPGDAKLLSDLSALYSERAHQQDRPDDYVAALEMADRAFSATPSAETAFNRALALEHLFLDGAARLAWLRFLASDDSSPWADEAKAHLAQLAFPKHLKSQARPALTIALWRFREQRGMQATGLSYEASPQTLMARRLDSVGQPAEAWKYRYRDLAKAHSTPWGPPPQLIATLDSAVTASLKQGRPSAALDFQSYSLNVAKNFHQQKELVLGLLRRSRIEAVSGSDAKGATRLRASLCEIERRSALEPQRGRGRRGSRKGGDCHDRRTGRGDRRGFPFHGAMGT